MKDIIIKQLSEEFKRVLERIMIEERERYLEEHRDTRANGYYKRSPKTILGEMEINIPRTRDGEFKTCIIPERKRVLFMLDDIIRALFFAGVSARKTGKVIENLVGTSVSAQYTSSIASISQEVIEEFKNRELEDEYPVIYIDATYISLKRDSVEKEAVYVVMGIKTDGTRSILGYYLPGGEERATNWSEALKDLKTRGLKGVKMVVSDDLRGLDKAIEEVYPDARHQLCWFHLKKNIRNRVRKSHWNEILNELNNIMEQDNQEEAEKMMNEFIDKWTRIYRSFYNLRSKTANYIHFCIFPKKIRSYFSTTNWMERSFKELKDQLRIRGYMQTEESAEKFLYLFFKDKDERLGNRKLRYSELVAEYLKNL